MLMMPILFTMLFIRARSSTSCSSSCWPLRQPFSLAQDASTSVGQWRPSQSSWVAKAEQIPTVGRILVVGKFSEKWAT
jgi:hypothetical protein